MSEENKKQFCGLCLEEGIEEISSSFCKECNKHLCEDHTVTHKKKLSTKNHTLQHFELVDNALSLNRQLRCHPAEHYCKEHKECVTEIKCNTCQELICVKCSVYKHCGHKQVFITDVIEQDKEEFLKMFNQSKEKQKEFEERKEEVENKKKEMNELIEKTKTEINNEFDEIKIALEEKRQQLLLEVNDLKVIREGKLESEITQIEENLKVLRELRQLKYYNSLNGIDFEKEFLHLESSCNSFSKTGMRTALQNLSELKFENNKKTVLQEIVTAGKIKVNNTILEENIVESNTGFSNNFESVGGFNCGSCRDFVVDEKEGLIFAFNRSRNCWVYNLNGILQYSFEISVKDNYSFETQFCLDRSSNTLIFVSFVGDYLFKRYSKTGDKVSQFTISKTFSTNVSLADIDKTNGDLYICDKETSTIHVISKEGKIIRKFGDKKCFNCPISVTINYDNNQLIISDRDSNSIMLFTKEGKFIKRFGNQNEFDRPTSVTYDNINRNYIVGDKNGQRILVFNEVGCRIKEFSYDSTKLAKRRPSSTYNTFNKLIVTSGYLYTLGCDQPTCSGFTFGRPAGSGLPFDGPSLCSAIQKFK